MVHREDVPLPIDDAQFLQWREDDMHSLESNDPAYHYTALCAQMIMLNRILIQINDYHNAYIANPSRNDCDETFRHLSQALDRWYVSLPASQLYTPENLHRFIGLGLGRIFIAVYMGYYHFGQLLYYQYLHEESQPNSTLMSREYAARCKSYAASLCELVYTSHSIPECTVLWNWSCTRSKYRSTSCRHTVASGSRFP